MEVVPAETVTGEKLVEQPPVMEVAALTSEKLEVVPEAANEIIPGEVLEQAASEIVASEIAPAVVTQAALVPEPIVAAVVSTPAKQTSEEEEGLIEGIVNTFIGDGKWNIQDKANEEIF